ncbi:nitroreductase family protein [Vagococcus sp. BWB3-3]|uniref:Nitroreductase family protein n=1 Tax=Vagococcus allomyrinae TaxID=2794353 RepID=A0A940SW36_9ENTE|nr:nitroreductase family protein [Vagococcus allomyrinae]MBP1042554.1 nitroreductase family protein [Vagococcus allomyrinae]
MNANLNDIIKGRKSVRAYDPTVKISKEEMTEILSEATLAPSSVNMQPWRFVVAESDEVKAQMQPLVRFNTRQNETAAAMIVIFGDLECYEYGEEIYETAVAEGKMSEEVKEQQLATILPLYQQLPKEQMNDIVKIDASLAAMQLMLVARAHGYETNPIGGFEAKELTEVLGLDPERYVPVMIVSIGKAAETGYNSIRLPIETFTTWK